MTYCPTCGAQILGTSCSSCGSVASPTASHAQGVTAPARPPGVVSEGVAIVALLLNILVLPGLGSLIASRKEGWPQLIIFIIGIPLSLILIGIPMVIGAWVWGIVTGVQIVKEAGAAASPAPA